VNRYDDFRPDVPALLESQETALTPPDPAARSGDRLGIFGRLASLAALYGLGALVGAVLHAGASSLVTPLPLVAVAAVVAHASFRRRRGSSSSSQ